MGQVQKEPTPDNGFRDGIKSVLFHGSTLLAAGQTAARPLVFAVTGSPDRFSRHKRRFIGGSEVVYARGHMEGLSAGCSPSLGWVRTGFVLVNALLGCSLARGKGVVKAKILSLRERVFIIFLKKAFYVEQFVRISHSCIHFGGSTTKTGKI